MNVSFSLYPNSKIIRESFIQKINKNKFKIKTHRKSDLLVNYCYRKLIAFNFEIGVPGKLSDPIASELGPGWVSLRWTRPESPAPLLAYRVEAWDTSEGARWVTVS